MRFFQAVPKQQVNATGNKQGFIRLEKSIQYREHLNLKTNSSESPAEVFTIFKLTPSRSF